MPWPPWDMASAQPVVQGYYTTWVDEIWNTTFKERRWGRGRRKPNKRDILLSAKNQEGKREKNKKPTTICLSRMAGWLPWHRGLAVPGEIAALLPHSGLRTWQLCPGSQHCPGAAASLQRLGKRHPQLPP